MTQTIDTIQFTFPKDLSRHTMNDEWVWGEVLEGCCLDHQGQGVERKAWLWGMFKSRSKLVVLLKLLFGVTWWKAMLITRWGEKPRAHTSVPLSSQSAASLWKVPSPWEQTPPSLMWQFSGPPGCWPLRWGWHWAGSGAGSQAGSGSWQLAPMSSTPAPWGGPCFPKSLSGLLCSLRPCTPGWHHTSLVWQMMTWIGSGEGSWALGLMR